MNANIRLLRNEGFRWNEKNGIYVKGYFYLDGVFVSADTVLQYLSNQKSKDEFINKVLGINGCFSIVAELDDCIIALSDTVRSFPLFYAEKDGEIFISDEAEELVKLTGYKKISHDGLMDFLHCGCVLYNETLIEGISQVSAMSYMCHKLNNKTSEYSKYKSIYGAEYTIKTKQEMMKVIDIYFRDVASRLVKSLDGRTAVVALSGGVDSRACLVMLKMMNYKNVICYTYGWENNGENEVAERVADYLGYQHIYVPHKKKDWRRTYKDKKSLKYIRYAGNLNAIAHMESHYIIRHLLDKNLIPDDSIMISGHIGLVASSKFDVCATPTKELIKEMFWKYWMKLYNYSGKRKAYYDNRLDKYFPHEGPYTCKEAEVIFENASFDSVRSKHIINYNRQFELHGLEWRLPLMDYEFMSGFEKILPGVRDKEKTVFSEYVLKHSGEDIKPIEFKLSYFAKALRNLRNPVYKIITPIRFLFSGKKGYLLPPFPIRQYRFLRRFYSYCALQEIELIEKWLSE